jgi:hypothetical protein
MCASHAPSGISNAGGVSSRGERTGSEVHGSGQVDQCPAGIVLVLCCAADQAKP